MSKILVLDNDLGNADVIQLALEEQNHQVKNINQADLLNESIKNFKPDLIVMDIILDVADGRDLCNLVKKKSRYRAYSNHVDHCFVRIAGRGHFLQSRWHHF